MSGALGDTWEPGTWRDHEAHQMPTWPDAEELKRAEARLAQLPPLVFAGEARRLTADLADVSQRRALLLQAGDCAESFHDVSADSIRDKLKVILQMAVVLTYATGVPVVKVGRIAGQFAKPRTQATEEVDGVALESFRGHMVNDEAFDAVARTPDPWRMVAAYEQSAATLNLLRAFTKGGFADLTRVHAWNQEFVASSLEGRRYTRLADEIERALTFMRACGIDLDKEHPLHEVDFFTSHEALILNYEEALTRRDSLTGDWYDCSAHLVWIGERTRQPDGAHVAFAQGISNPIACKLGPTTTPAEVVELARAPRPGPDPGPPDARHAHGRGARGGPPRPAHRGGRRRRPPRRVGVRPDARQHDHGGVGSQDPPLRRHPRRAPRVLLSPPLPRDLGRRRARRAHRGRRGHRVPGWRRGDRRSRTSTRTTRRSATRG